MTTRTVIRNIKRHLDGWFIISMIGAALILLPIIYVLASLFFPANENWAIVKEYLLTDYIIGSTKLVCFTGFFATFLGVGLAWLVVGYSFPLSRIFRWAFILPLAIPPYIAAYTYGNMTSYTGMIQSFLRNQFDIVLPPGTIIEVVSTRGAIFVLTMFLFPYVFLIACTYLERQSASYVENAVMLGRKGFSLFFRVVIPIARPAIIAGTMLVIFEVLSDYGVASYFGMQTISTAIFQTWFNMYDVDSATRLAAWLMMIIIGIFFIERWLRRHRQFHSTTTQERPLRPMQMKGMIAWCTTIFCLIILLLAFILPLIQIIIWTSWTFRDMWRSDMLEIIMNSITGAAIATSFIILIALITARTVRTFPSTFSYIISRLMTAGYAVPGAIIAIGMLAVFIKTDGILSPIYVWMGKHEGSLVLSMSLAMLIAGYIVRFMAVGYNAIESGYEKIPLSYSHASRMLAHGATGTFVKVELPLLKSAVFTAIVLTFIEIVKELPLTLLLRPFNFDTLSTRTFQYAMDERIYEAALPSLLLIMISFISVLIIIRLEKGRKGHVRGD